MFRKLSGLIVSEIRVKEPGINYIRTDTITIAKADTGTAQNVVATISSVTPILGPMLYDRTNHTYKWTDDSVKTSDPMYKKYIDKII